MAVLHKKEEKIQAVLGRLPKKYTDEEFVAMFIKLYSKDWGKIKSAYVKQSQDKEPGTVINMPKPDLYLKQVLENYLHQTTAPKLEDSVLEPVMPTTKKIKSEKEVATAVTEKKPVAKKKSLPGDKPVETEKKPKTSTKTLPAQELTEKVKKPKAPTKKALAGKPTEAVKKTKASVKKTPAEVKAPVKVAKPKAAKK